MARMYGISENETVMTRFFAHRREGEPREQWQPLIEHLKNTVELAREFGQDANIGELAYIADYFTISANIPRSFNAG